MAIKTEMLSKEVSDEMRVAGLANTFVRGKELNDERHYLPALLTLIDELANRPELIPVLRLQQDTEVILIDNSSR